MCLAGKTLSQNSSGLRSSVVYTNCCVLSVMPVTSAKPPGILPQAFVGTL